jgi:DNA-binding beta-propeller fold protein YncE
MIEPSGLAASNDGKNLYAAAHDSNAVVALNRNTTTGVLSQDGTKNACISEDGSNGTTAGTCVDGRALSVPRDLVVSPDDKHVYMVTETSDAVAIFSRNATTGLLTQAAGTTGCISNGGAATCATGRALDLPKGLTITPDGNYIYVGTSTSGSQGLAAFSRDSATGGSHPTCRAVRLHHRDRHERYLHHRRPVQRRQRPRGQL